MTNRLELNWKVDGDIDEQRYYCSETPIDPENLPDSKLFLSSGVRSFIDDAVEVNKTYYVCIGAIGNGVEKLSDVIKISTKIYHVWLEFNASGIVKKGDSSVQFNNSGCTFVQMPDGTWSARFVNYNTYLYSSSGDSISGDCEIEMEYTPITMDNFGAWYDSRQSSNWLANGQLLGFNNGDAHVEFRNASETWAGGTLVTDKHVVNKKTKVTFRRIGNVWKYYIDDEFVSNLPVTDPFLNNVLQNQTFIGRVKDGNPNYYLNGYLHRWSIRKL